ncbi:hypothetical protein SAM23877_6585 [Streptomyces ambofaciens ATCC 23877]|uniref:Uncharacterized protein n=1 Tax=Streptomyces ambofaciens (strain ATCC 23877 / 3486 / DSM 40053 / JCM 4204 / NBRC 12836 / NRRL B-2516) TaxID=278992 RepID=A0A0K2B2N4_STRA7|nr:hypothetical protein SAM23877_6585 [Streptomyces ambofaciens ATCC 23877]
MTAHHDGRTDEAPSARPRTAARPPVAGPHDRPAPVRVAHPGAGGTASTGPGAVTPWGTAIGARSGGGTLT